MFYSTQTNSNLPYLNTANVLSQLQNGVPYVADQNCYIAGQLNLKKETYTSEIIDGVLIGRHSSPPTTNIYVTICYPLKKGQTITITCSDTPHEYGLKAFELM